MNFENEIKKCKQELTEVANKLKSVEANLNKAKKFTAKFLKTCTKYKIKKVVIGVCDKELPESANYPFNHKYSVFASERTDTRSPAIWSVVSEMAISGGCGSTAQHQISEEGVKNLIDGIYICKNGIWEKQPTNN